MDIDEIEENISKELYLCHASVEEKPNVLKRGGAPENHAAKRLRKAREM